MKRTLLVSITTIHVFLKIGHCFWDSDFLALNGSFWEGCCGTAANREVFPRMSWYLFQLTFARSTYSQDFTKAEGTLWTVLKRFEKISRKTFFHKLYLCHILSHPARKIWVQLLRTCLCLKLILLFLRG